MWKCFVYGLTSMTTFFCTLPNIYLATYGNIKGKLTKLILKNSHWKVKICFLVDNKLIFNDL